MIYEFLYDYTKIKVGVLEAAKISINDTVVDFFSKFSVIVCMEIT